jgi:hypothetical protein
MRLRYRSGPALLAILFPLLLGCPKSQVGLKVGERIPLEEAGLRIERLDEFDRGGRAGPASERITDLYLERGYLAYRVFRIRNTSTRSLHFYLPMDPSPGLVALQVKTRLQSWFRRDEPATMDLPDLCVPGRSIDYLANLHLTGAQLEYAGGGIEEVPFQMDPERRPELGRALLRPGETVDLVYRLELSENTPLIRSLAGQAGAGEFAMFFYPTPNPRPPLDVVRSEILEGRWSRLRILPELIVLPERQDLHRVHLPGELKSEREVSHPIRSRTICKGSVAGFPEAAIGTRLSGLPELVN